MDIFIEQVVKREKTIKTLMTKILAVVLLFVVPLFFVFIAQYTNFYLIMVGFFLFIGGIYIVWYVFDSQKVEYEYSISGEKLNISKIISLRQRKRVCQVDIKEIQTLDIGDDKVKDMHFRKLYFATINPSHTEENYFASYKRPGYGKCLLIFNPNEKILNGMRPYLKKDLVLQHFVNKK